MHGLLTSSIRPSWLGLDATFPECTRRSYCCAWEVTLVIFDTFIVCVTINAYTSVTFESNLTAKQGRWVAGAIAPACGVSCTQKFGAFCETIKCCRKTWNVCEDTFFFKILTTQVDLHKLISIWDIWRLYDRPGPTGSHLPVKPFELRFRFDQLSRSLSDLRISARIVDAMIEDHNADPIRTPQQTTNLSGAGAGIAHKENNRIASTSMCERRLLIGRYIKLSFNRSVRDSGPWALMANWKSRRCVVDPRL